MVEIIKIKPFKNTNDAYVDIYEFLKKNINIKFSTTDLRDLTKLANTVLKTALRNLYLRHLIIKEKDMDNCNTSYMYYCDDTCQKMLD